MSNSSKHQDLQIWKANDHQYHVHKTYSHQHFVYRLLTFLGDYKYDLHLAMMVIRILVSYSIVLAVIPQQYLASMWFFFHD